MAFAVCNIGASTEAGSDNLYVKFGAIKISGQSSGVFSQLLHACHSLASARGLHKIRAGVNIGRIEAYQQLISAGFRTDMHPVAMQRNNEEGYNHSGVYLLDDCR